MTTIIGPVEKINKKNLDDKEKKGIEPENHPEIQSQTTPEYNIKEIIERLESKIDQQTSEINSLSKSLGEKEDKLNEALAKDLEKYKNVVEDILKIDPVYLENGCKKLKEEVEDLNMTELLNQKSLAKTLKNDVDNLEELLKKAEERFTEELKKKDEQYIAAFVEQWRERK